jgi:hypothetical protein
MHDDPTVRTTLDIDDDVLQAVKELAEVRGVTRPARRSRRSPGRR